MVEGSVLLNNTETPTAYKVPMDHKLQCQTQAIKSTKDNVGKHLNVFNLEMSF